MINTQTFRQGASGRSDKQSCCEANDVQIEFHKTRQS
jgi:hypothetical protein